MQLKCRWILNRRSVSYAPLFIHQILFEFEMSMAMWNNTATVFENTSIARRRVWIWSDAFDLAKKLFQFQSIQFVCKFVNLLLK